MVLLLLRAEGRLGETDRRLPGTSPIELRGVCHPVSSLPAREYSTLGLRRAEFALLSMPRPSEGEDRLRTDAAVGVLCTSCVEDLAVVGFVRVEAPDGVLESEEEPAEGAVVASVRSCPSTGPGEGERLFSRGDGERSRRKGLCCAAVEYLPLSSNGVRASAASSASFACEEALATLLAQHLMTKRVNLQLSVLRRLQLGSINIVQKILQIGILEFSAVVRFRQQ